jgi:hypothetical protein
VHVKIVCTWAVHPTIWGRYWIAQVQTRPKHSKLDEWQTVWTSSPADSMTDVLAVARSWVHDHLCMISPHYLYETEVINQPEAQGS